MIELPTLAKNSYHNYYSFASSVATNSRIKMEFKVFTLNCWGIPGVSKDRRVRMQAISEYLATNPYDVVCLQEVWTESDFVFIKEKVIGALPFSHYFFSGVMGSGVCILARHPIQDVFFHQWPVNGYVHKLQHGDWFGGKGIGLCRLKICGFNINVYSAHLHAEYNHVNDEYQAHRVLQAFDTAQFIQLTSGNADLVVLAGDLNTEPGDIAYKIILNITGFEDSFVKANDGAKTRVGTNENHQNSYTSKKSINSKSEGNRIDYILYHGGPNVSVNLKTYALPLPERVPNNKFSYSDHEAVSATVVITRTEPAPRIIDVETCSSILKESINICEAALRRLNYHKILYWFITALLLIILVASFPFDAPDYYRIIVHFARAVLTLFICFTFIMGSLWNKIETNAIVAGKLAMEVNLKQYCNKAQTNMH